MTFKSYWFEIWKKRFLNKVFFVLFAIRLTFCIEFLYERNVENFVANAWNLICIEVSRKEDQPRWGPHDLYYFFFRTVIECCRHTLVHFWKFRHITLNVQIAGRKCEKLYLKTQFPTFLSITVRSSLPNNPSNEYFFLKKKKYHTKYYNLKKNCFNIKTVKRNGLIRLILYMNKSGWRMLWGKPDMFRCADESPRAQWRQSFVDDVARNSRPIVSAAERQFTFHSHLIRKSASLNQLVCPRQCDRINDPSWSRKF